MGIAIFQVPVSVCVIFSKMPPTPIPTATLTRTVSPFYLFSTLCFMGPNGAPHQVGATRLVFAAAFLRWHGAGSWGTHWTSVG